MTGKKTSSQEVYDRIRDMILNFDLYPGSRVTELNLCDMFHVSRTPIRAALQRLEAEGYLTIRSKQGCFVRSVDINELSQYYAVRITLELLSLQLACTYMSDASLRALADAWDPAKQEGRVLDADEMEARDEEFHITLAEGGENLILARYLNDLNRHIRIIRRLDFTDSSRVDRTYEEHYQICRHLLRRDLSAAQRKMQAHITRSENFAKTLTLTQLARSRSRPKIGS